MKKKKTVIILLAVLLVAGLLYAGDMFLGNPISRSMVKQHSQDYIQENYSDQLQLQLGDIYYDWYNGGGYDILVTSPVSRDTRFNLRYDRLGRLLQDTYEMDVASGNVTFSRLVYEYAVLVNAAIPDGSQVDQWSPYLETLDVSQLVVDAEYDVSALGKEHGWVHLYIFDEKEEITIENAAEILLETKEALEEAGVGFCGFHLYLTTEQYDKTVSLDNVTAADLEQEGVTAHLTKMWKAQRNIE